MIRMIQSSSAGHAKAYFTASLQKSDYYMDDQELQGRYMGNLADRLGLGVMADKETFFALCENVHPYTGEQLTPRTREERTVGYDINFHSPKSVSIIHALSGDDHILNAFQASVTETMRDIEADSKTRVRKGGAYDDRATGELVWADFTHQTARPVDGSAPDPHLHSHCFVFNATWDESEQKIKAGQFRDIKRDMPYYQQRFHKILSDKLMDLGYQIRRTDTSFEIAGVPQGVIGLFSKRSNEIGQFAKEKGITDAKELDGLGARTRGKKQKGLSMAELKTEWQEQIREQAVYEPGEQEQLIRFATEKEMELVVADDCVSHALDHAFERASVMDGRRILATAYRQSIGLRSVTLNEITNRFEQDKQIIHVKEKQRILCTTHQVLKEEQRMVKLARTGQGRFRPLYSKAPEYKEVSGGQAAAVTHVLTTSHQVSIVRGGAGTGKTTLMREAIPLMEQAGKKVTVVAPTAEASRGVLMQEGFTNAETVAKLLVDKNLQDGLQGGVLWVDEAGLLGTKDMTALLDLAGRKQARLILGGDTRQHASVVRGDALRILNTVAGIEAAEVSLIRRQRNLDYRQAVEELSKGNIKAGFAKLESMGVIKDVKTTKPNEALVSDYIATVKKGKTALIVSPTHKQSEAVTEEVRGKLKAAKLLGKRELVATKLSNKNLTEAQKSDWRNFEKGQIVQFSQNVPKIKRGSIWSVDAVTDKAVTLKNTQGEESELPLDKAAAFDIFHQSELALSKGDKVKITRNAFDAQEKRLNNGQALEVVSVNKSGKIVLKNTASKATFFLDKDFGHIVHAYCTTSHSSQGKTVDEVFISQPASTFSATDAKQFYVSVSRGRDAVHIYTDDKEALLENASAVGDRRSALELIEKQNAHSDMVEQLERNKYAEQYQYKQPKENINLKPIQKDKDYEPEF